MKLERGPRVGILKGLKKGVLFCNIFSIKTVLLGGRQKLVRLRNKQTEKLIKHLPRKPDGLPSPMEGTAEGEN